MANPIPEGYELLSGRTRQNAITALATAEERGLDSALVLSRSDGFLIPLGDSKLPTDEGTSLPTEKDTHAVIDQFAGDNDVTFDGIEAADAEKPTKAEKVAHITKVLADRDTEGK